MPYQRVGDIDLYFELHDFTEPWRAGPPPVLFLHGLGGDHRMWHYQVPAFSSRYPTLTLDLRGHGLSTKPAADFSLADMASDVIRLLRAQGIERAHLVGLSLGGLVAQQVAVDFPPTVASLVLCDTFAAIPDALQDTAGAALQLIEHSSMAEVAKTRITNAFSDHVEPALRDYWIDEVAHNDKQAYHRAARATFTFSIADRLQEVRVPVLVVMGEEDRVTPPFLVEDLARRIPGAQLARLPRAGHICNAEQPGEFNRIVLEFLNRL